MAHPEQREINEAGGCFRGQPPRPFGGRELESLPVVEGVAGERSEAGVLHQGWIEGGVDGQRRPTLIARFRTVRAYNQVVVNTDGNGLCVAKAIGRCVAACTGIIVVQAADRVKPGGAAQLSPFRVDRPA